ncbi:MAG: TrmH family RNA methyltransferase [Sphaerochaetaceae bacterium]|nr:TrmH family RNA methyltransferase [Sphaerochaetaceae bacterium]
MLTEKKLLSLKERTRIRKISMILAEAAHRARLKQCPDLVYINTILPLAGLKEISTEQPQTEDEFKSLAFRLEDYSQALLTRLGAEPSDWDFTDDSGDLDVSRRTIQDKILILDRLRSPYNVGAVFRSADSFGIKKIILVEGSASPEHQRARRTARGTTETVEWTFMSEEEVVRLLKTYKEGEVLALELGGENINTFSFPVRGAAVLGSEEFGISPEILGCCTGRITIPMAGTKGSLNVSVAAGILLQAWFSRT